MNKYKISEEIAENQIQSFLDFYELDVGDMPEQQRETVISVISKLKKAVRRGNLQFKEDGTIVQYLRKALGDEENSTIEYKELTGRAKLAMGKYPDNATHSRMYALLGALSGLPMNGIAALRGADLSIAECLGCLFLLV